MKFLFKSCPLPKIPFRQQTKEEFLTNRQPCRIGYKNTLKIVNKKRTQRAKIEQGVLEKQRIQCVPKHGLVYPENTGHGVFNKKNKTKNAYTTNILRPKKEARCAPKLVDPARLINYLSVFF